MRCGKPYGLSRVVNSPPTNLMKKPSFKTSKNVTHLAEHDVEVIRMKYCGGLESKASICREFNIDPLRLDKLAKQLKWQRVKFKDGTRIYGKKELVIRGARIAYVGPLTPEERELVSAATADVLRATITPHRHASYKAIMLANQYLDKLIANQGMEERLLVQQNEKGEDIHVKMLVPGQNQLLTLAKIMSYAVPLDRQAMGLDPKPGAVGDMEVVAREKQAKAQADALMAEFKSRWEEKIALLPKIPVVLNGHANGHDTSTMGALPAEPSG